MVKRVFCLLVCVVMLASTSLALAGGAPVYAQPPAPCGPNQYAPQGNPCAYWGDAPFPGLCGGVVALPFLVVGSLLGGNTVGPYGPAPAAAGYKCGPPPMPPRPMAGPMAPACGPGYGPQASFMGGGSMLGGLPCLELCTGLLGSLTGGMGLGL